MPPRKVLRDLRSTGSRNTISQAPQTVVMHKCKIGSQQLYIRTTSTPFPMRTGTHLLKAALVATFITPPILDAALPHGSPSLISSAQAQVSVAPTVQWRDIMPALRRPDHGYYATWNGSANVPTGPATGGPLVREEGGEDWWYAHCNLYDSNGEHVGSAAAGYNTVPNWYVLDGGGCFATSDDGPDVREFETGAHRKGSIRSWLARYDLEGNMVWCKSYMMGVFYGVTQGPDGSILAVGEAAANRRSTDPDNLGTQWPIKYNPGITTSGDITALDCNALAYDEMALKATVLKVDLDGNVIWQNFYAWPGS